MTITKYCDYCGEPITRSASSFHADHEHFFCNSYCDAMYKRKIADLKNFANINEKDFRKNLYKDRRLIGYAIRLCRDFINCRADIEDFIQICRIECWKLLSRGMNDVDNISSYKIESYKNAIKRYVSELGKNKKGYLDVDPVYFSNPEAITRQREILRALDSQSYKELLAQAWSDKSNEELAKDFGTSKQGFIIRCSRQRQRLKELMDVQ